MVVDVTEWRHHSYLARCSEGSDTVRLYTRSEPPDLRGESGRGEMLAATLIDGVWSTKEAHPYCQRVDVFDMTRLAIRDFDEWFRLKYGARTLANQPIPSGCRWQAGLGLLVDEVTGISYWMSAPEKTWAAWARTVEVLSALIAAKQAIGGQRD